MYFFFIITLPLQIDAPNTNDLGMALPEEVETQDGEEIVTNGRDLFKKFEQILAKDPNKISNHQ